MIRSFWKRNGPPVFLSNIAVAKGLGIDLLASRDEPAPMEQLEPMEGPSIAELAARVTPPIAGGETLDASREIFRAMLSAGHATAH